MEVLALHIEHSAWKPESPSGEEQARKDLKKGQQ